MCIRDRFRAVLLACESESARVASSGFSLAQKLVSADAAALAPPRVSALVRAIARRANDPSGADAHTRLRCLQLALTILQRPGGCPSDPAGVASLLTPCFRFLEAAEAELEGGRGGSNPRGSGSLATPSAGSLGGSSAAFESATRVAAAATARQAVDVVFDRADARDAAAAAALVADLVALADGWRANWLEANPSSSTAALRWTRSNAP